MISKFLNKLKSVYYTSSPERFASYLRKRGLRIGKECRFVRPKTARIDITRPSLIEIGDNVTFNVNFQLLTHDFACRVFRIKYHDFVNSSGKVVIGNNVWVASNVTFLKGVTIGDNCVIGAGSLVTHDIPTNSVAAGVPAKVICSIDDYYEKRKAQGLDEAREYVRSIRECFGREPLVTELYEEFIYFVDGRNINEYTDFIPRMRSQLGPAYDEWIKNHKAPYRSMEEFLKDIK